MNTAQIKSVTRKQAVYLVEQLMTIKRCSRDGALEVLMQTSVYEALMDPETDLYLEPREALLEMLKDELNGNPNAILDKVLTG